MVGNIYKEEDLISQVNITNYSLPRRESKRINQFGGPSTIAYGKVIPGNITFEVKEDLDLNFPSRTIQFLGKRFRLDIMESYSNLSGTKIVTGFLL